MIKWLIKDSINPAIIEVFNALFTQAVNVRESLTVRGTKLCIIDAFQRRERWQCL